MNQGSITAGRNDLAGAITYAATAINRRPDTPVMAGMPVNIWAGHVTFGGFDYDTGVTVKVHGEMTEGAATFVDGRALLGAIKAMPTGKRTMATLTIEGDQLTLTCEGMETALPRLEGEGYPLMPAIPEVSGVTDASLFCAAVSRVTPAAGTDDTLPVLTHVCMSSDLGQLELATCDRYRLAIDHVPWTGADGRTVLFPAVVLARFAKSADHTGKVTVHIGATHAALSDGTRTVITRTYPLSETGRTFPDYTQFIRPDHDTVVTADAKQLHAAVARAAKLSGKTDRTGFDVASGRVTITAVNRGQVVGTEHVRAAEVDGPEHSTGFSAPYLASMLAGFTGPVRIGLKTRHSTDINNRPVTNPMPAILTAEDSTLTAVIMPIKAAAS
jgi:DNA polymerase-3 subunit beta